MPVPFERRTRFPPDARSAGHARRMLQETLRALPEPGLPDEQGDTLVLLASELCENAVLHAGTEFEVALRAELDADGGVVTVAVTDRGAGALELHLAQPRARYGRAATHGRGLELVARLSAAWGTRHDADGRHTTWFALTRGPIDRAPGAHTIDADTIEIDTRSLGAAAALPTPTTDPPAPGSGVRGRDVATAASVGVGQRAWATAEQARWLLHVPAALADQLQPEQLVAELVRRLRELLDVAAIEVELDDGDGSGPREVALAGGRAGTRVATEVALPVTAPLRGVLRVREHRGRVRHPAAPHDRAARDLTELVAARVGMAVESRWLRGVDQRRRSWMTYLAETSELLGQSLDVELAVAVVPQVVVPRLGRWCAVHLRDGSRLTLAALTHADERALPDLRGVLDPVRTPGPPPELRAGLAELVRDGTDGEQVRRFAVPTDAVAVALRARGRVLGTLLVGRPAGRAHTPEDVVLVADIARRAALAIHNAQSTAAHVAVSQALQSALLPRALPVAPGLDLAAAYLPASSGSDVGGDFYDVTGIDPTRWLISIGDVCGKGARAAARTGLVRDVLRVLVRDGRSLVRAVEMLNQVMIESADPLQFATLAAAVVGRRADRPGLDVELLLAGHVQPVLVRASGRAELVGEFGTAVGLLPRVRLTCTQHRLEVGDALLVYTDGVTERRRGRAQFGADRLLQVATDAAGSGAARLVGAVRDAVVGFSGSPLDDDVALLAVRATG